MATTKATTLAHTLGGISSDISTAEINRLDGVTGDLQTQLDAKAPIASPTFTGTITAPNDSISGDAVSGGQIGAGLFNGTLGNNAIFPTTHVIQTQYQKTYAITQDTTSSTDISATHLEKSITITAGNSVFYSFNFTNRMYANSTAWAGAQFFIYHKEGSGSYSNAESGPSGTNWRANLYYDETGNLPGTFYNDTPITIIGIHTPSSGTVHSYKLYYKFVSGSSLEIGVGSNTANQYVVLQEIQA